MNDIDKYIAGFPEETQIALGQVRTAIIKAAPQAVETIKYAMPTYVLNGNLIHFAAFKRHIGLYPAPHGNELFEKEISGYRGAKSSIRIPLDKPIPVELITRIVEFRIRETKYISDPGFIDNLSIEPLTKRNWNKFVKLFGENGACAIAWCAFAPREDFIRLENSRVHARIDDKEVWSMPCFFIDKNFRVSGVSVQLLKGAIKYARENSIKTLEAYPTIPTQEKLPDSFAWVGLYKSFERAGFEIVDRTSGNRPMVRYYTDKNI
jgi:uncharacterized protein YdhG (YjbR/CyaY superfamily)